MMPPNEVHIFIAPLTATLNEEQALFSFLNQDEQLRARRFIAPEHQQRFIIAHGLLRKILARYLGIAPHDVKFTYSDYQKPFLAPGFTHPLQFNISHSEGLAVFALTSSGQIGVDIEKIRPEQKIEVAERFFSPSEITALKSLSPSQQTAAFYRLWARKEALIKANGKGLSQMLSSFSVATEDVDEVIFLEDKTWSVYPLLIHPEFAGALAIDHPVSRFLTWEMVNLEPQPRDA